MYDNAESEVSYTETLLVLRNYLTVSARNMEMKPCLEWTKLMKQVNTINGYGLDFTMARWICPSPGI
jgi:hypothetical protein